MTDREKLIDLMCHIPEAEEIADFFLANGVTFAKDTNVPSWIPVSERLPELREDVLLLLTCGDCAVGYKCENYWRVTWINSRLDNDEVTHWMPLPEPPKEDS